jgi:uncharacterized protein DUF5916/cellulose/xylan binding protein with CBM9 domain
LLRCRAILVLAVLITARLPAQPTPRDTSNRGPGRTNTSGAAGHRSADGRRELTASRTATPVRIDGVLGEDAWKSAEAATDFVQAEPLGGQPASEPTEVRVLFDAENIYVGAYLHDHEPRRLVVTDLRKDFTGDDQDDFEVLLDTFGDRRNAYVFSTNVEGARHDRQVALEGREVNQSWDAVWEVKTQRVSDGWTAELRIPFRALRFSRGTDRVWGVNFSRHIRRKNEVVFWSPVPRAFNLNRVSLAGNLVGLETGSTGRDLRLKPYIAANATRDLGSADVPTPRLGKTLDVGADLRAALTPGLTADLTANPDFAQVEADEQQVNLTQFSQFFPEKRDFFLENSGVFYVGDAARNNRVNPTPTPDEDNLLFFSRRMGLNADGVPVPITGGARLTGKLSETLRVGLLSVQEQRHDTTPAYNSSVLRLRQNLWLKGSDAGLLFMQRASTNGPSYRNRVLGADGNIRLLGSVDWNSYFVRSETPGIDRGAYAWRSTVNYEGNRAHFKGGVMALGAGFQNDLGYYRRTDVRKWLLDAGIRPRSTWLRAHGIREIHPHATYDYLENLAGNMVGKRLHNGLSFFFNNGGVIEYSFNPMFQRLDSAFDIYTKTAIRQGQEFTERTVTLPAGGHGWAEHQIFLTTDQSRVLATNTTIIWGGLWTGRQRSIFGTTTWRPSYRFHSTLGIQRTDATLPQGSFVSSVYSLRTNYSFTTNMFVDALTQYTPDSRRFNANVRFNLIHHPLSDFFLVYNDQRFLTGDGPIPGRSVVLKFTQMIAM